MGDGMSTYTPAEVFPPGEFIKEELEARGWTQRDLAAIIDRPVQAVNELISGKRSVTPDTARALGEAFGTGPELWMNLESAWRLSQVKSDTRDIARRSKLYSKAPVNDILKRGWIEETDDPDELERRILQFMGMNSLDDAPQFSAAARKSTSYATTTPAQVAWLRRAAYLARSVQAKPFRHKSFVEGVKEIRELAGNEADARKVPRFLSSIGVRFVLIEHLPGTRMDGAAFWIEEGPVVAISLRYDRIDHLWFCLGHELGHIAKADRQSFYDEALVGEDVDSDGERPEAERIADAFSESLLVPQDELDDFIARVKPLYSRTRIIGFANRIGVHPGIVVGQLHHRDEIGFWHSRPLLAKVRGLIVDSAMTDGWGHNPGHCA